AAAVRERQSAEGNCAAGGLLRCVELYSQVQADCAYDARRIPQAVQGRRRAARAVNLASGIRKTHLAYLRNAAGLDRLIIKTPVRQRGGGTSLRTLRMNGLKA